MYITEGDFNANNWTQRIIHILDRLPSVRLEHQQHVRPVNVKPLPWASELKQRSHRRENIIVSLDSLKANNIVEPVRVPNLFLTGSNETYHPRRVHAKL